MSKPTVEVPPEYLAKARAIAKAQLSAVAIKEFQIKRSTWYGFLQSGLASQNVLDQLNSFFAEFGDPKDRLPRLDWVKLKTPDMAPHDRRERSELECIGFDSSNLTDDAWSDIRRLYLDRRNDEAFTLARSGVYADQIETRLASAQSLVYLNSRLGRLSAIAGAVNELRRTAMEYPTYFSRVNRIRTAADIAKCLAGHGHPLAAARLFDHFEELCRSSSKLIPAHVASSLMRGVAEYRYCLGRSELAYRDVKYAAELAGDGQATRDDHLSHANALVFYSSETRRNSKSLQRDRDNVAEDLQRLQASLLESAQSGSAAASMPSGLSLATLIVVMVTSAFSGSDLNERGIRDLVDQRADWLFRAGLADNKIIPCGMAERLFEHLPVDRPGRQILASMVKSRMRTEDARRLAKSADELLKSDS